MGEWSKSVGEKGEKILSFLLKEIVGHNTIIENEPFDCIRGQKHKRKEAKGERTTHGIDALVSYESPLEDNILETVLVSSKFTSKKYPTSPKATFKEHINDLAYSIECYRNSKSFTELKQNYSNISRTDITGVLVWTSNKNALDYKLLPEISNSILDQDLNFDRIIVIDNDRINFLYDTIYFCKQIYGNEKIDFIYHNTSLNNISLQSKSYGKILPIQYLFSDVIPIRIQKSSEVVEIVIFCKDSFNQDNFSKILSFAKTFDHLNSVNRVTIAFNDFDDLENKKIVLSQLIKFPNYKYEQNLFVKKYPTDFRNT